MTTTNHLEMLEDKDSPEAISETAVSKFRKLCKTGSLAQVKQVIDLEYCQTHKIDSTRIFPDQEQSSPQVQLLRSIAAFGSLSLLHELISAQPISDRDAFVFRPFMIVESVYCAGGAATSRRQQTLLGEACQAGNAEIATWILTQQKNNTLSETPVNILEYASSAAALGSLEILECLVPCINAAQEMKPSLRHLLRMAARNGHLDCAEFLINNLRSENGLLEVFACRQAFESAVVNGHLTVAQHLLVLAGSVPGLDDDFQELVLSTLLQEQLPAAEWLLEKFQRPFVPTQKESQHLQRRFAKSGNIVMFNWFLQKSAVNEIDTRALWSVVMSAAHENQVEFLRWLFQRVDGKLDISQNNNELIALSVAIRYKQLPPEYYDLDSLDGRLFDFLVHESGQLDAILLGGNNWVDELQQADLETIAILGFGVDPAASPGRSQLRQKLQSVNAMSELHRLLNNLNIPRELSIRQPYILSKSCQKAAESGLPLTLASLEKLRRHTTDTRAMQKL